MQKIMSLKEFKGLTHKMLNHTYNGILFGESEAIQLADLLVKAYPNLKEKVFNIIKESDLNTPFEAESWEEFDKKLLSELEELGCTIVGYYGYEDNEVGLDVLESILKLLRTEIKNTKITTLNHRKER